MKIAIASRRRFVKKLPLQKSGISAPVCQLRRPFGMIEVFRRAG
jgi:hypothetical protein